MPINPELQKVVSTTLTSGCEVTLDSLITALNVSGLALDQLAAVSSFVSEWSFELSPPLTTGDFTTTRILRPQSRSQHTAETIALELRQGENSAREFKSSLLYDYNRATAVPSTPLQQLRSEIVLFSALKTIAAFLNSEGGVLFIGVSDDSLPIGLREDCSLMGCPNFDADKWQLELRNQITGKFKDGSLVNDYVELVFVKLDGRDIVRVQVLAKKRLAFLKFDGTRLYRRQGNRTMEVLIDEVEDFLENRRELRCS